jgi:hypothetical protein
MKELDRKWGDKRRVLNGGSMGFRAIERRRNGMFSKTDRRTERKMKAGGPDRRRSMKHRPTTIPVRHCVEPLKGIRAYRSARPSHIESNFLKMDYTFNAFEAGADQTCVDLLV